MCGHGNSKLWTNDAGVDVEEIINQNINRISEWAKTSFVKFNPMKTEALNFTRKLNTTDQSLKMDNKNVTHCKHLGLVLERDGKWKEQMDEMTTRAM